MGQDLYRDFASIYDEFKKNVNFALWLEIPLKFFGYSFNQADGPLLDLGSGSGELCFYFAEQGFEVVGVDLSESMIQISTEKASQKGLKNVVFFRQDIINLDLKREFACIHSRETFTHLSEPDQIEKVFQNCFKILKKGGIFVFEVPTPYGIKDLCKGLIKQYPHFTWQVDGKYNESTNIALLNYNFSLNSGKEFTMSFGAKGYTLKELVTILLETGFKDIQAFDGVFSAEIIDNTLMIHPPVQVNSTTTSMIISAKKY